MSKVKDIYLPEFLSKFSTSIQNDLLFSFVSSHDILIMTLPKYWSRLLGNYRQCVQETWLHTAGNLTLTGYNSECGNRSFEDKRTMRGGFAESPLHLNFAESPLHLNKGLGELPEWTEKTIITRERKLADQAVNIWRAPDISEESLERFEPQKPVLKSYTIADHEFLQSGITRELFEAF